MRTLTENSQLPNQNTKLSLIQSDKSNHIQGFQIWKPDLGNKLFILVQI